MPEPEISCQICGLPVSVIHTHVDRLGHAIGAPPTPAYTRRDYFRDQLLLELAGLLHSFLIANITGKEQLTRLSYFMGGFSAVLPVTPPDETEGR